MLKLLLAALLLHAPAPDGADPNAQALATARAAVRDMIRAAKTPEEKALAEEDRTLVERAAALLARRAASREAAATPGAGPAMSFNLQYRQLQSQMQHENRSYTAVSNIMRTKHDTVKNSISNIR